MSGAAKKVDGLRWLCPGRLRRWMILGDYVRSG